MCINPTRLLFFEEKKKERIELLLSCFHIVILKAAKFDLFCKNPMSVMSLPQILEQPSLAHFVTAQKVKLKSKINK